MQCNSHGVNTKKNLMDHLAFLNLYLQCCLPFPTYSQQKTDPTQEFLYFLFSRTFPEDGYSLTISCLNRNRGKYKTEKLHDRTVFY